MSRSAYRHPASEPIMLLPFIVQLGDIAGLAKILGVTPNTVAGWLDTTWPTIPHQRDLGRLHALHANLRDVETVLATLRRDAQTFAKEWQDVLCDGLPTREMKPYHERYRLSRDWCRVYEQLSQSRLSQSNHTTDWFGAHPEPRDVPYTGQSF